MLPDIGVSFSDDVRPKCLRVSSTDLQILDKRAEASQLRGVEDFGAIQV